MFVGEFGIEFELGLEADGFCGCEDETMDDEDFKGGHERVEGKERFGLEIRGRLDRVGEEFEDAERIQGHCDPVLAHVFDLH